MQEIRIHGRGGQGVVTAAQLIAIAAFHDGKISQAFPSFGVERTGAPIMAFARIDDEPIRSREHIYRPNVVIIQDSTLIGVVDVEQGCDDKTLVIINTAKSKEKIKTSLPKKNIHAIDATKIALDAIGRNIVNTTILGAFAKSTGLVSLDSLKHAIEKKFKNKGAKIIEKNIKAIEQAYKINI